MIDTSFKWNDKGEKMFCKSKKTGKRYLFHCWHRTYIEGKKVNIKNCDNNEQKVIYGHDYKCCRCGKTDFIEETRCD